LIVSGPGRACGPTPAAGTRPGEELTTAIRRRLRDELGRAVGELTGVLPDFAYLATDANGPGSAPAEDGGAVGELDAFSDDAGPRHTGDVDDTDEVESGVPCRPSVVCQ
jgi:isopentenyldiphosphate isomerase